MSSNAALMLESALAVLRRQRPHVQGDATLEAAYRDGLRFWRKLFGDQVLEQAIRATKRGHAGEAARNMATLLAHAPLRLVPYVRHRLLGLGPPREG